MLALLSFFALTGLCLWFHKLDSIQPSADKDWRDSVGHALIVWGALIAFSTEILGAFHLLDRSGVLIIWMLALVPMLILLSRKPPALSLPDFSSIWTYLSRLSRINQSLLVLIAVILALTALTAVLSPPQEGDALAYHMGRVVHWIQNKTLAPYATPDSRQIWMPPWSEYGFTHLYLLAGNDQFVNLIQWIAMAGSVLLVTRVAGLLGADTTGQLFSGLFLATIPIGISQASGALSDYALAMWVVLLAWIVLRHRHGHFTWPAWLLLGLALGCGVLTKSNFVMFAVPLVLLLEWQAIRSLNPGAWIGGNILAGSVALSIVIPSWVRNIQTFGSILGAQEQIELHRNVSPWLLTLFSDAIRTLSMRLATPVDAVNTLLYKIVYAFHELLGVLPSDPAITYHDKTFFVDWAWPGEDAAAIHTLFLALAILFYLLSRKSSASQPARRLLLMTLISYFFYSGLFKWQGNARFYLAFYAVAAAPVGYMLGEWRSKWLQIGATALFMLTALPVLLSHHTRPLIPLPPRTVPQSILTADREQLTFRENDGWLSSQRLIADRVLASSCTSIGLRIDSSDLEYPWWVVLSPLENDLRLEHLLIYPGLETTADPSFTPCAVICTICDENDQTIADLEIDVVENGIYLYE